MRKIFVYCLLLATTGALFALPASADIPVVDNYWYWSAESSTWSAPRTKPNIVTDLPIWVDVNPLVFSVPNIANPNLHKNIWVEITFEHPQTDLTKIPDLTASYNSDVFNPVWREIAPLDQCDDSYSVLWKWELPYQPPCEKIHFGVSDVFLSQNNPIESIAVGTSCVPEPTSILAALSILGPVGVVFRRKRV